jgi:hypothetical protein
MERGQSRFRLAAWVAAALLAAGAGPLQARQIAKQQKEAATSGAQTSGGGLPLRVGLVIGDDVRTYRTTHMLARFEFGKHFATQAQLVFDQSFAAVRPMAAMPADAKAEGLDLFIVAEAPQGDEHQSGLMSGTVTLLVRFTVRDASGAQLFQLQESGSDKGTNVNNMLDRVGESVARKFIQDFRADPRLQSLLAPHPATPVEAAPVLADTAAMDSAGLDVPPPPPWGRPAAPPAGTPGNGRP